MLPDRQREIEFHRARVRKFVTEGNGPEARVSYTKWVESLRQYNIATGGALEAELAQAKGEYSEFVRTDGFYLSIYEAVSTIIRQTPGILQSQVHREIPNFSKSDIAWALYFAADHGKTIRTKKGRSYTLTLKT